MEGRTKFNYGYNSGLITMKDINYMFNIINSNLSEEEKAIKLYSFCNLHSLISNTGILSDGTQFDLLEFIKRIPFKRSNNFTFALIDFMKRNNPDDMNTIIKYIYSNGLNTPSAFAPLDFKEIYTTKTIINGVEITNADNNIIIDYLRVNNIPLIHKTYVLARTKYLNGEITTEMVQKQKEQLELNKIPTKVLIPSKK